MMTITPQRRQAPIIDDSASLLLTSAVQDVIDGLIDQVGNTADLQGILVRSIHIRRFMDNDQGCPRLLVETHLAASHDTVNRFLDRFTDVIDAWYRKLPEQAAALFIDTLLFDFRWSDDEPAR